MESITLSLEGISLLAPAGVVLPFKTIAECPSYCGAGQGIGDWVIPEKMFGLKISPACYIHDEDWAVAPPTWEAFHAANSRFLHNLIAIVEATSKSSFLKHIRLYRCVTYYNAVDSRLNKIFWILKNKQQIELGMWKEFSPVTGIMKELVRK